MILAQVWEAIFAQTSTGHSIFSRAFQAQILLGCEASVPQLSKLVHNLHIHAKMGALRTKFKVKIYHGDWDQIFHTFKKWTFWHPLTQKLVKMVMPQYIEGGFMLFSKIHDSHSTTSDQISWLHSDVFYHVGHNFKTVTVFHIFSNRVKPWYPVGGGWMRVMNFWKKRETPLYVLGHYYFYQFLG